MSSPSFNLPAPVRSRFPTAQWLLLIPLILFLALNLLLRSLIAPSLHGDGADILLFDQTLAWGYSEQAPLFSWIFWLFSRVFGTGVVALGLLRGLLLGATVYLLYRIARSMLKDDTLAVLAAFSILLFPTFLRRANFMTHSMLLSFFCAATFYCFLHLLQKGQWQHYLLLGGLAGLGMLSKHNYVIFLAALVSAALTLPPVRQRILNRRFLIAMALAGLIFLPHLLWLWQHRDAILSVYQHKMTREQISALLPFGLTRGTLDFFKSVLVLGGPLLLVLHLIFRKERSNKPPVEHNDLQMALLLRTILSACAGLVLIVLVTQSRRFPERWLEPFFLLLPIYLFSLYMSSEISLRRMKRYVRLLLVMALIITSFRVAKIWHHYRHSGEVPMHFSFAEPARELIRQADSNTVVVAEDPGLLGNLRPHLPNTACLATTHPSFCPEATASADRYLIIWRVSRGVRLLKSTLQMAQKQLGRELELKGAPQYIEAPPLVSGGKARPLRMACILAVPKTRALSTATSRR